MATLDCQPFGRLLSGPGVPHGTVGSSFLEHYMRWEIHIPVASCSIIQVRHGRDYSSSNLPLTAGKAVGVTIQSIGDSTGSVAG